MKRLARNGKRGTAVLLVALFLMGTVFSATDARALDLSDEKKLGRKIFNKIRERFDLIEDGELVDYIQSVGSRVVKKMDTVTYDYRFYIVDQNVPNAFAIPGGYIFIYRGLMEMMDSEGELAGIISHELAHVQARHIHERLMRGRILNIAALAGMVAGAFLGMHTDGAQALAQGALAGVKTLELQYSRDQEEEADRLGFVYLTQAGYDPHELVSIMDKIGRSKWRTGIGNIPSYLSTHPGVGERVNYLDAMVERYYKLHPQERYRRPVGDFQLIQAALVSDHNDADIALSRFDSWGRDEERKAAAAYGLGRLYLRTGRVEKAIPHLEEAASMKPASTMVLASLGSAYYKSGRMDEARRTLEAALMLNPDASTAHFNLALVLQETGKYSEALRHLRRAEQLAPLFPEIDYHMGVILGRMKQLGPAHFHLGRYHQQKRDFKLAVFHYKKALPLLAGSPEKQEIIEEELEDIEDERKRS